MHECTFSHLTDKFDECTFVQLAEKEDEERTTVWIETDNKLIESKKEKPKEDKNEEETENENSVIKNVYFLNAQTLRVEVNEWISKNMSLKKIVGILDDLPWNEIGITLSLLNLTIFLIIGFVSVRNYFKEVRRIFKEKEREDDLELEDLVTSNTFRNTVTSVLRS